MQTDKCETIKHKKNVCMIVYAYYAKDQRVRREAEALATLPEYSISVLTLKTNTVPRCFNLEGVEVLEMNEEKYRGKSTYKYLLSYFKFLFLSLVKCIQRFFLKQIDIIHVHNMPNFLVLAGIIPRLFGKKLILDIHDSVPETYMGKFNTFSHLLFKLFSFEEYIFCAIANKVICVNHVQRDVLVKRRIPLDKITICMNVPDDKRFNLKNIKKNNKSKEDKFKMIYHGTITKRLGVDLIIQAVAYLSEKINNHEFNIWGNGDDLNEFIRLSEVLNVQDRIFFKSPGIPLEKLPLALSDMDLGVIGNRKNIATELMLPVKMLEYVSLGIPVVAPRLKGIEYYFSDEMVCYYEPEDIKSMANAILKLYQDESLRKIQADKAMAFLNQYGWDKHKMGLINLYKKL